MIGHIDNNQQIRYLIQTKNKNKSPICKQNLIYLSVVNCQNIFGLTKHS